MYRVCIVGTAENGDKGWELFKREKPDIFFVDIKMPAQDGLSMIEKIKREYRNVKTKFIVISGYDDFEYMQKAIQVGVVDYVRKPLESEPFIRVLEKICNQLEEEEMEESKKMTKGRMIFWRDFYKVMKHKEINGTYTRRRCLARRTCGSWRRFIRTANGNTSVFTLQTRFFCSTVIGREQQLWRIKN